MDLSCCIKRCRSCLMVVSASARREWSEAFVLLSHLAYCSATFRCASAPSIVHHSVPAVSPAETRTYVYERIRTQFAQHWGEWCTSDVRFEELPGSSYRNGAPAIRLGSCLTPASTRETTFFKSMKSAHFFLSRATTNDSTVSSACHSIGRRMWFGVLKGRGVFCVARIT